MKRALKIAVISAGSAALLAACGENGEAAATHPDATAETPAPNAEGAASEPAPASALDLSGWGDLSADFVSPSGEKIGSVSFKQAPNGGVLMRASLSGLSEGWHGIHLHRIGDCSDGADGFKASGGHIDPEDKEHGLLNPNGPEAADMPNIYAGANGVATAAFFNGAVSITGDASIADADGFAVIVHENPDDHMTQPIGGAGSRVACAAVSGA